MSFAIRTQDVLAPLVNIVLARYLWQRQHEQKKENYHKTTSNPENFQGNTQQVKDAERLGKAFRRGPSERVEGTKL